MTSLIRRVVIPTYSRAYWVLVRLRENMSWGNRSQAEWVAWNLFARLARATAFVRRACPPRDRSVAAKGFKQGLFTREQTQTLIDLLGNAKPRPQTQNDYVEGYVFHETLYTHEQQINSDITFLGLSPEQLAVVEPITRSLRDTVAAYYGSPWRIVNVRGWVTHSRAQDRGPNAWHSDGMPPQVCKLLVYLSGVGPQIGTTEFWLPDGSTAIVEGPPGTWILFNPSVQHRGIPPEQGERMVLEFIVAPDLLHDQMPYFAGMNAHYPHRPWFRVKSSMT